MQDAVKQPYELLVAYRERRDELLGTLQDSDLSFALGGDAPTFRALIVDLADTEAAYTESFRSFTMLFNLEADTSGEETVADLQEVFTRLDGELEAVLETLGPEDLARQVDRGGHTLPPQLHLEVLREAHLIFYGKASVYLKVMGKPLPGEWPTWIE